jgi:hypothetical protein
MSFHTERVVTWKQRTVVVAATTRHLVVEADNFWKGREYKWPIPVAARSKVWVCGGPLAGIVSSNTAGGMDVWHFMSVVLSGRGLQDGLITHPEESYRVWCV